MQASLTIARKDVRAGHIGPLSCGVSGITSCIPPRANRKIQYHYDKALYRQRDKIENVFGRIKGWRRVATRYDRCAHTFMSAISIAATFCYWL